MKQQDIKVFLAIAKHKSLSAAAEALHYTQPTVSGYLSNLEQSLGVQLVKRTKGKREIELTPAGTEYLQLARRYEDLENQFALFAKTHQHGILRLAASVVSHQYIVCHVAQKLLRAVPDVEIRLSTLEIKDIGQAVEDRSFDVAITYDSPAYPRENRDFMEEIPLFRESYSILCPIDTPLPDRLLTPEELDPAFEIVHEGYGNTLIREWHDAHGFGNSKPFFTASSMLSLPTYLTDPRCWSFVLSNVALQLAAEHPGSLTVRHVSPAPADRICNALILRAYPDDTIIETLLRCVKDFLSERPHLHTLL